MKPVPRKAHFRGTGFFMLIFPGIEYKIETKKGRNPDAGEGKGAASC